MKAIVWSVPTAIFSAILQRDHFDVHRTFLLMNVSIWMIAGQTHLKEIENNNQIKIVVV